MLGKSIYSFCHIWSILVPVAWCNTYPVTSANPRVVVHKFMGQKRSQLLDAGLSAAVKLGEHRSKRLVNGFMRMAWGSHYHPLQTAAASSCYSHSYQSLPITSWSLTGILDTLQTLSVVALSGTSSEAASSRRPNSKPPQGSSTSDDQCGYPSEGGLSKTMDGISIKINKAPCLEGNQQRKKLWSTYSPLNHCAMTNKHDEPTRHPPGSP